MATRGTYCIEGDYYYIHYDNYPEGAAIYLKEMLDASGETLSEKFRNANPQSEKIVSHEDSGDSNYKYDLQDNQLMAYSRFWHGDQFGKPIRGPWKLFYKGTLTKFLDDFYVKPKRTLKDYIKHRTEVIEQQSTGA